MYKELSSKIFNTVFNQAIFTSPTQYFNQLIKQIKSFPKTVKSIKDDMIQEYGSIERYKNYRQEFVRKKIEKERAKEQKSENELESRIDRLKTKNKQQNKQIKPKKKRRRGMSR